MSRLNDKLKEIEEYIEKATPAPWPHNTGQDGPVGHSLSRSFSLGPIHVDNPRKDHFDKASRDSDFIYHSRTDLPKLVKALRCAVEALKWYDAGMPFDDRLGNEKQKAKQALKEIVTILEADETK